MKRIILTIKAAFSMKIFNHVPLDGHLADANIQLLNDITQRNEEEFNIV